MTTGSRKSGFAALGPISWGTHLCHFYESRSELLSVTAEFLHAGLANREVGVWVAPALLGPDKARYMLTRTAPALAEYVASGQLQILDGAQLYARPKSGFDGGATVSLWSAAINDALGRGFEGLRVAGDAVCNETTDWAALLDYEAALKHRLAACPIIGMCTYCVQQLRTAQTREIERLHDAMVEPQRAERAERPHKQGGPETAETSCPRIATARDQTDTDDEANQPAIGPMIGHEIRNAITPLGLLARLLNAHYGHDEQLSRYALLLSRQASLLGQLAEQLMAPAHAQHASTHEQADEAPMHPLPDTQAAHPTCVDVDDLLAHCSQVAELGVPAHAPIHLTASSAPLLVQGDFGKLTQVFVNLMLNALKYSAATDSVKVMAARAGRYCYISVRDNGIGIAPGELATIFKPYARGLAGHALAVNGLGLGLSVVRDIVADHGGTVEAFSNGPGTGSEFVVRLPLATLAVSTQPEAVMPEAEASRAVCAAPAGQGVFESR
ncbi:MEDS domain-containing protein [Paraburkholderia sp. IMGN_8]|uniref:MEDS domain-containing protein n=1 Tax=Paraburkholderia sp. IMGN_8 TaxID=3136564 RepID=UPI003100B17A